MSIKQINKVWHLRGLSAEERLVLLCLADGADDAGNCWPSKSGQGYIAEQCEIARSTVVRVFGRLEKMGFLKLERSAGNASKISLHFDAKTDDTCVTEAHPTCSTDAQGGVAQTHRGCSTDAHPPVAQTHTPINKEERPKRTSLNVSERIRKPTLDELTSEHISEWLTQKRSEGKYLAVNPESVLEGFKDYCRANGRKYTDWVAAYRNAFGWERFQPEKQKHPIKTYAKSVLPDVRDMMGRGVQ